MGMRIAEQSSSGGFTDQLAGLNLEEEALRGLSDDAASQYSGLTVGEARESIAAERDNIGKAMKMIPDDFGKLLSKNPELMGRFIDRYRLVGGMEAVKWLHSTNGGAK